uniref:DUF148 domain-containing protein n=1 Tax=Meloidogyne hapla TaxID=6305 RepID=A0A1I8BL78_MELHA
MFCLINEFELANGKPHGKRRGKQQKEVNNEEGSSSRRKGKAPAVQQNPEERNFPQLEFSLVEIAALNNIMLNLQIGHLINYPDSDLHEFLERFGNMLVPNPFETPPYTETFNKLDYVNEYYKKEIARMYNLEKKRNIYGRSKAKNKEIITKRLTEIGKTMIAEKFREKIKVFVKIPDNIVKTDDVINHAITNAK